MRKKEIIERLMKLEETVDRIAKLMEEKDKVIEENFEDIHHVLRELQKKTEK